MYKNLLIIALTGCCSLVVQRSFAQQDPQFSMNFHNKLFVNPAYAGMNDAICVYGISRQQWVGYEGRPESYVFGVHGTFTVPYINLRSGGGLSILSDGLGQMRFFGLKGIYSAHIPLNFISGQPGHLGVGVSFGLLQFSMGSNWRSFDSPFIDPIIPDQGFSANKFDMDFGLFYQTEGPQNLYFGISSTHLNAAKFIGEGVTAPPLGQNVPWKTTFRMTQHYYIIAGYNYPLPSNTMFVLKPSLFAKTEAVSAQIDLNMTVEWNGFAWGGLTYRYTDAVVVMGGLNWSPPKGTIKFGYAYDITTSAIATGSNGSHELFLQYCLKLKKPAPVQKHKSVRFL
ncbi:MAG: type IX secretion system membrane protein PorP/SprF [Salibacteraceae bacterium]